MLGLDYLAGADLIVTGAEFDVINYPNAHHGFDQPHQTIKYKGHTLAYSADATADSRKRVKEFFVRYLTDDLKAKKWLLSRSIWNGQLMRQYII